MAPFRLPLAATCAVLTAAAIASPAFADPPWSAPSPVPGVANGPATATPRGSVVILTDANRTQPPGTASLLVRIGASDGSVRSSTGVDLANTAIAAYGSDHVAVAGTSIGPSGTIDSGSRVRVGTVAGASGAPALHTLSGTQNQNVTALAGNARGDVALSTRGGQTRVIWLKRRGSSTFAKVLTIRVTNRAGTSRSR